MSGIGGNVAGIRGRVDVFASLFNGGHIDFKQQLYDSSYKLFYKPGALVTYPNTKVLTQGVFSEFW